MKKIFLLMLVLFLAHSAFAQAQDLWGVTGKSIARTDTVKVNTAAQEYFSRLINPLPDSVKVAISNFLDSAISKKYYSQIIDIGLLANSDTSNAKIGLKGHVTTQIVGAPTFTKWKGFTGASGKYLLLSYSPSLDSIPFVLPSGGFGVYSLTNNGGDGGVDMGANGLYYQLAIKYYNNLYYALNGGGSNISNTNGQGFFILNRTVSDKIEIWKNGSLLSNPSSTASGLNSTQFYVFQKSIGEGSTNQLALWIIIKDMTQTQIINLSNDLNILMTALKCNVY